MYHSEIVQAECDGGALLAARRDASEHVVDACQRAARELEGNTLRHPATCAAADGWATPSDINRSHGVATLSLRARTSESR